jgi:hypothetical protein
MEEALGSSNTAQVLDLLPNNANLNIYTPAYAIYEGKNLELLFNYVTDSSGASDLSVQPRLVGLRG